MKLQAIRDRIGISLRGLRLARGLTQTQVEQKCRLPKKTLARYERGGSSISLRRIALLCRFYKIDVSELFEP